MIKISDVIFTCADENDRVKEKREVRSMAKILSALPSPALAGVVKERTRAAAMTITSR